MRIIEKKLPLIKWSEIPKFKDKSYGYSCVQCAESDGTPYMRLSGINKKYAPVVILAESDWRAKSCCDIMLEILEKELYTCLGDIPSNMEDALLRFYKNNDGDFGYYKKMLRNYK